MIQMKYKFILLIVFIAALLGLSQRGALQDSGGASGVVGNKIAVPVTTVRTATESNLTGHAAGAKSVELRVLAIGSSVAEGWADKQGGGYLARAFQSLSKQDGTSFNFVNKSVAGDGVLQVKKSYPMWLAQVHPNIVVISWGALDDLYDKTPIPVFQAEIRMEITDALREHAVVYVVTPPVTRASYTDYRTQESAMLAAEMTTALALRSPNVYVFDVFNQMKKNLVQHHQTYAPYMADGWHPNTLGHELAGQILFADVQKQYASGDEKSVQ